MPHTESLPRYWDYEGLSAARKLIVDILAVEPGQTVVITNDSTGDDRVSQLIATAAYLSGAIPIELRYPTSGRTTMEPPLPIAEALKSADVWVELSRAYILDSGTQLAAQAAGVNYTCLTGMDVDTLVRTIGNVDIDAMTALGAVLVALTEAATAMHVTCSNGSRISAEMQSSRGPLKARLEARTKGRGSVLQLGGQVNWTPSEETVEGIAVFDGSVWPPDSAGVLLAPITVEFERGYVRRVSGQWQAAKFEDWLRGFGSDEIYRFSHFSYGYNPGVLRPSGRIVEDERVFGCLDIGLGSQTSLLPGYRNTFPAHTDGTILKPTILLDDLLIEKDGVYTHPELVKACRALGVSGY